MSHRTVCRWVAKFSAKQQQPKDAARPGRPATTTTKGNIDKIRNILKTDAGFTIRLLTQMTKIVSEYDQVIPQSQTADNTVAPRGRATQPSRITRKTN